MTAHLAAVVHHACCFAVANHESNAGADASADHRAQDFLGEESVGSFINPKERGCAMKLDGNAETPSELPPIMRQWKSEVIRGAQAADDASDCLGRLLDDSGQSELVIDGLTRADLLAVDADVLEMFLADLWDLQEQIENAAAAIEAVIAAVDKTRED